MTMMTKEELLSQSEGKWWKDLVGFQPIYKRKLPWYLKPFTWFIPKKAKVFYLSHRKLLPTHGQKAGVSMVVGKSTTPLNMNEEQLDAAIRDALHGFPRYEHALGNNEKHNQILVARAKHMIARNSRRGVGNTRYEDVIYYKSTVNSIDVPLIVSCDGSGKWGLFKHPDFNRYGFVLQ